MIDFCVLGSGISGSTIANLLDKKFNVLLIDKARGIGGRASNKTYKSNISFDHGLQYFSSKEKKFNKLINQLHKNKILKIWEGPHLDLSFKNKKTKKFIGRNANNDLNKVTELLGRHKTLPLPSIVKITNLENGLSLTIKIIDRHDDNASIIQVSRKVAQLLRFYKNKITNILNIFKKKLSTNTCFFIDIKISNLCKNSKINYGL